MAENTAYIVANGHDDNGGLIPLACNNGHHPSFYGGKMWQCCEIEGAFSEFCQHTEYLRHHPGRYNIPVKAEEEDRILGGVSAWICCFPLMCCMFSCGLCVYAVKDGDPELLRISCCYPTPVEWTCCRNPDRHAEGCEPGPHPWRQPFFESLLPAGVLNRDEGFFTSSVDVFGNSILSDKRDFGWIGNEEYKRWLQTPTLLARCERITIKLTCYSNGLMASKLSVRLVRGGEVVATEEVSLEFSKSLCSYDVCKSVLAKNTAGDVIEVYRYSGPTLRHQMIVKGVKLVLQGESVPVPHNSSNFMIKMNECVKQGAILTAVTPELQQIQFVAPADMNRGDEVTVHTTTGPNIVTMNEWRVSFMQTSVLPSASGTAPTIFWLDSDGNCMCFLGLRFHQGCFVMNARFGFWGKEERQDIALGVLGTDSGEETGLTLVVKVTDVGFEIWYNNAVVYTFLHRAPWETFSKVCTGVGCTATRLTVDLLEPAAAADTVAEAQDSHKATVALYRRCVAESDDEFAARNRLLQAVPCEALLVSSPSNMAAKGTWAGTFVVPHKPDAIAPECDVDDDYYNFMFYPSEDAELKEWTPVRFNSAFFLDLQQRETGLYCGRVAKVNEDGSCDLTMGSKAPPAMIETVGSDCFPHFGDSVEGRTLLAVPRSRMRTVAGVALVPGDSQVVLDRREAQIKSYAQKFLEVQRRKQEEEEEANSRSD